MCLDVARDNRVEVSAKECDIVIRGGSVRDRSGRMAMSSFLGMLRTLQATMMTRSPLRGQLVLEISLDHLWAMSNRTMVESSSSLEPVVAP